MNPQHLLIDNACRIEVFSDYNKFTEEQQRELICLLDDFYATKTSNIFKFQKRLKKFEDLFVKYGGNHDRLEESIKKIRDETYIQAAKVVPGLKVTKDGKEI